MLGGMPMRPVAPKRDPADGERAERADRFRLLFWRVETLIDAGYLPEQAGRLGRELEVDLAAAIELVRAGVPPADATERLLGG